MHLQNVYDKENCDRLSLYTGIVYTLYFTVFELPNIPETFMGPVV